MFGLDKMGLIPKSRAPRTVLELGVIAFSLWIAMPISVSLFPQRGEIRAVDIESEFRELRNGKGLTVDTFYYNKGL